MLPVITAGAKGRVKAMGQEQVVVGRGCRPGGCSKDEEQGSRRRSRS